MALQTVHDCEAAADQVPALQLTQAVTPALPLDPFILPATHCVHAAPAVTPHQPLWQMQSVSWPLAELAVVEPVGQFCTHADTTQHGTERSGTSTPPNEELPRSHRAE